MKVCSNFGFKIIMAIAIMLSVVSRVHADSIDSEPHNLVTETTDKVFTLLKTGIDPVESPDEFLEQLSAILEPAVAFQYIAKGVMGVHAKKASQEQIAQFASAFRKGLVSTYGKGITGFDGVDVKVVPPSKPIGDSRRATVVQEIRTSSGLNKVAYSMAKNKKNQWKVINLVINGINFGKTFRGQFAAAVEKNDGDVAKTISEWENGVGAS